MNGKQDKNAKKMRETIIQFDSCTALLNAQARYLHSKNFFDVGLTEKKMPEWVGPAINLFPQKLREIFYSWSGWLDAIPSSQLNHLDSEDISKWVVSLFPERKFNGIMFGSANGAAVHICSALGIPWLPQTYLLAVKRFMDPDQIKQDIDWGRDVIRPFLDNNPQMMAVQMHDPVQDRLMIQKMGYFRIKRRQLGECFRAFIKEGRESQNAPLISVECRYPWHQLNVSDRHYFQLGGFGAMTAEEYLKGSSRVSEFLKKVNSPVDRWDAYEPTGSFPEGEWGFVDESIDDLKAFAHEENIPLKRLVFDHPEGLSEFVADLYRWWYEQRGLPAKRLIVENFGLVAPYDVVESSSLPFWLAFNTQNSCERLKQYLRNRSDFDEIFLMLMSNGVTEGIGLTTIEEWKEALQCARVKGDFIGVDEREYPLDFGTFLKYDDELLEKIKERHPLPQPLSLAEFEQFIGQAGESYPFEWISQT